MTNQHHTAADWERVGRAVTARMTQLGLTQTDVVRRSDVSDMTIRPLQYGEPGNYRPSTLAKVAIALNWPHDAISRILEGDDPGGIPEAPDTPPGGNGGSSAGASYDERINALPATARKMIDGLIDLAENELNRGGDGRARYTPV